jgi:hypothetical protein
LGGLEEQDLQDAHRVGVARSALVVDVRALNLQVRPGEVSVGARDGARRAAGADEQAHVRPIRAVGGAADSELEVRPVRVRERAGPYEGASVVAQHAHAEL